MHILNFIKRLLWDGSISGKATSIITVIELDKEVLTTLIPEGLLLAPQQLSHNNKHPVYFAFNLKQQNVTTPIPFFKLNYSEFAMGIPYLQLKESTNKTLYAYSPVLYLNSIMATIGGQIFYSLPKKFAHITITNNVVQDDTTFKANHILNSGKQYLDASFNTDGPAVQAYRLPQFNAITPLLTQPLIIHDTKHGFRSTDYQMHKLDNCYIQPVKGNLFTKLFLPGLQNQQYALQSINNTPLGTFKITYPWSLSKAAPIQP